MSSRLPIRQILTFISNLSRLHPLSSLTCAVLKTYTQIGRYIEYVPLSHRTQSRWFPDRERVAIEVSHVHIHKTREEEVILRMFHLSRRKNSPVHLTKQSRTRIGNRKKEKREKRGGKRPEPAASDQSFHVSKTHSMATICLGVSNWRWVSLLTLTEIIHQNTTSSRHQTPKVPS